MIKKEDVLKTLKKYGFYSLNRAPYLYQDKENIGIYFVWPNKHFRNLERVLYFEDEDTLEEEVYKYWWFCNHKQDNFIEVEFDNYEVLNPKVIYKYKNSVLNVAEMKNFDNIKNQFIDPEEDIKKRQLLRTANILILVFQEKFKLQNETFLKVSELSENLRKLTNNYYKKVKEFNKDKNDAAIEYEVLIDNHDDSDTIIHELQDELMHLSSVEDLRSFIESMIQYIEDLDGSEAHLQNIYLLNRYPYEIEDMNKKIQILDSQLKLKKKLFKNKKNVMEKIEDIERNSPCKQMLNVNVYIEKEKQQILSKYQNINEISENVLGDYLVSFDKLNITLPPIIDTKGVVSNVTNESLLTLFKEAFEKLNKKEKSACYIASSFLKDCLNVLASENVLNELNATEIISKLIVAGKIDVFNEAYQILDHYTNAKIRVKYFSILKMNSFETFISSLVDSLRILNTISIKVPSSFYVYFKILDQEIISLYLKNIFNYSYRTTYFGIVHPNVCLYYSPIEVVKNIDILDNTELVDRENNSIFLLNSKVSHQKSNEKVVVTKYEKDKVINKKDYVVITNVNSKNKCTYYEDLIYNKESEETL